MHTTKCILIVDDDDDIREVAQLSLEMLAPWQVLTAASGSEGLIVAQTQQPDAIILDYRLPDIDAVGVLTQLRANLDTAQIPVILLTAKDRFDNGDRFDTLGVKAILAKPFDPVNLASQIADVLKWELSD
ncbi:response regulator [Merismopedia glauca]|uniref:Two-component system response regulator n=1 Tax=Merismopedia glauca CCAP 1448/3 TaxID=1296344 RepID=A0A2T1BX07_9CYAN|nr:response regulator [Merismopedia glauca]PSB00522.1 two-component system response regulator [Merismopedia glauca CCAP 1448/3]